MKKRPPKDYVNNTDLLNELILYKVKVREAQDKGLPRPGVNNYIGECIMLIASNLSNKGMFNGYSYKDEMVGEAIETVLKYIHNFDENKTKNPFAYITQITYNSFLSRLKKEKKQSDIKKKALDKYMTFNEGSNLSNEDANMFQNYYTSIQKEMLIDSDEVKSEPAPVRSKKKSSNTLVQGFGEE